MFSHLVLDNFKAFGSRQVVPLAPITLVFGDNSAGKSSLIQALLILKQTLSSAEAPETALVPKGDLVNLGSFRELVYSHDTSLKCEITPILDSEEPLNRWLPRQKDLTSLRGPLGMGFRFALNAETNTLEVVELPHYWHCLDAPAFCLTPSTGDRAPTLRRGHSPRLRGKFFRLRDIEEMHCCWDELFKLTAQSRSAHKESLSANLAFLLSSEGGDRKQLLLRRLLDAEGPMKPEDSALGQVKEDLNRRLTRLREYSPSAFLEDIRRSCAPRMVHLRNFLPDDVVDLAAEGPSRRSEVALQRWLGYQRYSDVVPDLIQLSLNLATAVGVAFDRLVYLGPLREYPERHYIYSGNAAQEVGKSGGLLPDLLFKNPELVGRVNQALERFDVGYSIEVHRIDDPAIEDVFGLRLMDKRTRTSVSMLDVGFGISQVLPVIVQGFLSAGDLIVIEQPEIHLHPRLQAELGSLFVESAKLRGNQFIVETHSEHLILRLQRLIRNRVLSAKDVSVLYVGRGENGSFVRQMRLDDDGDFLDHWPDGFFEEGFRELFSK